MPTVPRYNAPQVEDAPRPAVRQQSVATPALLADAASTGNRLFQGMSDIGNVTAQIAADIQDRNDIDAVFRAETQLKQDFLNFDADIKKNRRGAFAKDVTQDAVKWWDEQKKVKLESLGNDRQRALFVNRVSGLRLQSLAQAQQYELQQADIAYEQSYRAVKVAEVNVAATLGTEDAIVAAKANITRMNTEFAARRGLTSEVLVQLNAEDITRLHDQTIERLAAENPDRAMAYYEKYKGEITSSETRTKLAKLAEHANAAVTSVAAAGEIFNPRKGIDEMQEEARKRFKNQPETLRMTIANLSERYTAFKAGEGVRLNQLASPLRTMVMQGAAPSAVMQHPLFGQLQASGEAGAEAAEKILVAAKNEQLRQEQRAAAAASRAASYSSRQNAEEERQQRMLERRTAPILFRLSDPTELMKMSREDVRALLGDIGIDNTAKLLAKWDQFDKDRGSLAEAKIDTNQFNTFLKRSGIDPFAPKLAEPVKQQINDIRNQVETIIQQEQAAKKRVLSREEKDKIMQRELDNKVFVDRWFGDGPAVPAISLTPDQRRNSYVKLNLQNEGPLEFRMDRIPQAKYQEIVTSLRRHNVPVTEQAIAEIYWEQQNPQRKLKGR